MSNEFFVSRVPASTSGPENIHFLTNLKRTLSINEAKRLVSTLVSLVGAEPKKPVPAELEQGKLRAFLLKNYKSETGNETPEACAIRLLTPKPSTDKK
jgi:hypothetical protein